jgi:hypothetical protein
MAAFKSEISSEDKQKSEKINTQVILPETVIEP